MDNFKRAMCYNVFMSIINIAILRGGHLERSSESVDLGSRFINSLAQNPSFRVRDVLIDQDGLWHLEGVNKLPADISKNVDIFINCLLGERGDDGSIQTTLEHLKKPFSGPSSFTASLLNNKLELIKFIKDNFSEEINVPDQFASSSYFELEEMLERFFATNSPPIVLKPINSSGGSGVSVLWNKENIKNAINRAQEVSEKTIIEEYIYGKEYIVYIVEEKSGELRALFPTEIIKNNKERKYKTPSFVDDKIINTLKKIFKSLNLKDYASFDIIIHPKYGVYLIEINTLPSLKKDTPFSDALFESGVNFDFFAEDLVHKNLNL